MHLQDAVCTRWDLKWLVTEFNKQHPTNLPWQLRASVNPSKASHSLADKVSTHTNVSNLRSSAPRQSVFNVLWEVKVQTSHWDLFITGRVVWPMQKVRGVGWGEGSGACFQVVTSRKAQSHRQWPMGESMVERTWYKMSQGTRQHRERKSQLSQI